MNQPQTCQPDCFIIPTEFLSNGCFKQLCTSLHFARTANKRSIFAAAASAGISYQELDALERGECRKFDFALFLRIFREYNQKLFISVED